MAYPPWLLRVWAASSLCSHACMRASLRALAPSPWLAHVSTCLHRCCIRLSHLGTCVCMAHWPACSAKLVQHSFVWHAWFALRRRVLHHGGHNISSKRTPCRRRLTPALDGGSHGCGKSNSSVCASTGACGRHHGTGRRPPQLHSATSACSPASRGGAKPRGGSRPLHSLAAA